MDASGNAIVSTPTSTQVSWQTILWILITLAANTMAQPCGKVLSFDSRYRIYMRSSTLICIVDAISIPLNLLILKLRLKLPWSACLTTLIHSRFGAEKEGEAWKAWKFTTPLRWLFFILGPLGPGIKMLSMDGIPWSKTWGLMFLVSFCVTELLVVLAWKINCLEGIGRTAASQTLDDTGVVLFSAALGLQVLVSIDCTFRLLSFPTPSLLSNPVVRVFVILWETLWLSIAVPGIIWLTWDDYWESHLGDHLGRLFFAVFAIFNAGVYSSYKSAIVDNAHSIYHRSICILSLMVTCMA